MSTVRVRLPNGIASQLDLGSMTPLAYAQVLADATHMWVQYAIQDAKGNWSEWQECYPNKFIMPITPTVALTMHESVQEE